MRIALHEHFASELATRIEAESADSRSKAQRVGDSTSEALDLRVRSLEVQSSACELAVGQVLQEVEASLAAEVCSTRMSMAQEFETLEVSLRREAAERSAAAEASQRAALASIELGLKNELLALGQEAREMMAAMQKIHSSTTGEMLGRELAPRRCLLGRELAVGGPEAADLTKIAERCEEAILEHKSSCNASPTNRGQLQCQPHDHDCNLDDFHGSTGELDMTTSMDASGNEPEVLDKRMAQEVERISEAILLHLQQQHDSLRGSLMDHISDEKHEGHKESIERLDMTLCARHKDMQDELLAIALQMTNMHTSAASVQQSFEDLDRRLQVVEILFLQEYESSAGSSDSTTSSGPITLAAPKMLVPFSPQGKCGQSSPMQATPAPASFSAPPTPPPTASQVICRQPSPMQATPAPAPFSPSATPPPPASQVPCRSSATSPPPASQVVRASSGQFPPQTRQIRGPSPVQTVEHFVPATAPWASLLRKRGTGTRSTPSLAVRAPAG